MKIAERVQDVLKNHSDSKKNITALKGVLRNNQRGFQAHSISDRQIRPYWEGSTSGQLVTFYNK